MTKFAVILPAAGKSRRFKDAHYRKPFAPLGGRAVWLHSAERFMNRDDVVQVIIAISPEDREDFFFKFGSNVAILGIEVVEGGKERADSIRCGACEGQSGSRVRLHPRCRPTMPGGPVDRPDLRGRRKDGRCHLCHPRGRYDQAGR